MDIYEISKLLNNEKYRNRDKAKSKLLKSIHKTEQLVNKIDDEISEKEKLELEIAISQIMKDYSSLTWNFAEEKKSIEEDSDIHIEGITISGNKDIGFNIVTPFPGNSLNRPGNYNKQIGNALYTELKNYLFDNGISSPVYKKSCVTVRACIGKDMQDALTPDTDNLDIKAIIDALGMTVIENDTLLSMRLTIRGSLVEDENSSLFIQVKGE